MKVCIIQPGYSADYSLSDLYFQKELELLDQCDETMDIIVMPESCDIPCLATTKEDSEKSVEKYNEAILKKANKEILRAHMKGCVKEAFACENEDEKIDELINLIDKFSK